MEADTAPRLFHSHSSDGETVALDPATDLYGGILFHQGRFRRLQGRRDADRVLLAGDAQAVVRPGRFRGVLLLAGPDFLAVPLGQRASQTDGELS